MLPRLAAAMLGLWLGAAVGWLFGDLAHAPVLGSLAGGSLGVLAVVVFDAARAHRLMRWLRGDMEAAAPRDRGFWGETGYRVERALRQRERALQQEQHRLQQFLQGIEASPNGVLLLGSDDRIEWCSSVAADHLGLDPVRDRQQHVTNLVRAPSFVALLQSPREGEGVHFPRPGGVGTVSVLVRRYGAGMTFVLTQDVTERERHDAMRREFVANVSHEIRTPLTVLAGFVETLADLPLTESERRRVLVLMRQQTDRMQTLVADLLTLAQLEGSPRPAADRWVALAPLLQRVAADAASLSAGRHLLRLAGGSDESLTGLRGWEIAGVESELYSAVSNLVSNAVRYTPQGGMVELAWRLRPDGCGEIEVVDTGIGIAREHLPRLTERFYRVDGSRSRDTGGTGLGLSIVKHAVQRHGGELDIQSEPGKGSRFRLVLPASRLRRQTPAEKVSEAAASASRPAASSQRA
jgi:two-component system phosphate regulon sensor histidine kinase PhoR